MHRCLLSVVVAISLLHFSTCDSRLEAQTNLSSKDRGVAPRVDSNNGADLVSGGGSGNASRPGDKGVSTVGYNAAERPTAYWPEGVDFDPKIPTPKQFFGFDIGVRHLSHAQVAGYVRELADSSNRVSVQQYAQTHAGRPLLLLTITSDGNRQRLGQIQKLHRQLTKANSNRVETDDLPVVINMGYGVHGDEASATNCAALVAYYLAAAQGQEIERWLDNCVILLDPSLNPDGFNRFANWVNRYRGRVPNPDSQHAEHNQMWPPGRVNYYWFDLNRDWLPLVHPESRGRMNWYHKWKPNVVLDFHEMGTNSTFFFQPGIPERTNPLTPQRNQELTRKFGSYHAKALDKRGSLYFTQERFDDFYMGKGSTYPDLHGSVGILFEQASSRGLVQENQDGLLKFHDTIANHFTASLSSLRATTAMRNQLNNYKRIFYEQALKMADRQPVKTYVFTSNHNRSRLNRFAEVLDRHDIQSYFLKEDLEYGDQTFQSESSLIVPARQSEFRFLKSLLMRRTDFRENVFYDVSSWTLPLAYGLQQQSLKRELKMDTLVAFQRQQIHLEQTLEFKDEHVAYMVDFRDDVGPWLLARLLSAGVKVRVATRPVTVKTARGKSKEFGHGTLSVVTGIQPNKTEAIRRILNQGLKRGAIIEPVESGLSLSGPDLGSSNFPVLKKPKIAMVIGSGTSAYSSGATWHLLDTQVALPVTMIKSTSFRTARLNDYTTLILAGGRLHNEDWSAVESYARSGGTVVAIGSLATSIQTKLDTRRMPAGDPSANPDKSGEDDILQKRFDTASKQRALKLISGAIFKTNIDTSHPLLYGFSGTSLPVFRNHATFLTPSDNPYCNPLIYDAESPLMAGYCSSENVEKFKGSASVVVRPLGSGRFILMADDPNFRGFWKATSRVFLNAIFFGELVDP